MLNLLSETRNSFKAVLGIAVCLLFAVSCFNSELGARSNAQVVNTPLVQVSNTISANNREDEKAVKLTKLFNDTNCREFFNVFPDTFEEFERLYGFNDKGRAHNLYSKYPLHFPFFFGCAEVSNQERLNKVIRIGIGGKYNDGVPIDMFHGPMFDLIKSNPDEAKEILDSLPDEKAASFWYFLFDAPHPSDKANEKKVELLRNVLGNKSKQSKILSEQYKKLLADWSEH